MHLTSKQAKDMGIEGGLYCGTITAADLLNAPSERDALSQEMISAAKSAETKKRLQKEKTGTRELLEQLRIAGLPAPRSMFHEKGQLRFHQTRRWKFDLAWEDVKVAVELQGFGSHTSVTGLTGDSEKACEAAVLGWTVLPVLYKQVRDGRALKWIEAVYKRQENLKVLMTGVTGNDVLRHAT